MNISRSLCVALLLGNLVLVSTSYAAIAQSMGIFKQATIRAGRGSQLCMLNRR